ncbi:hypothetical protein H5410_060681 [Solanum commersonii]|uniref:Uncharacterized protein n=1 Tax=Solanum commersonii TaxID=4109 RepID=A0A9J5W5P4_SOLCO|nr:hypothetical protein H5410_060681 [Solanum commersonii]
MHDKILSAFAEDELVPSFKVEASIIAQLFSSSFDIGIGISVLTFEMFWALGASGTSPATLLGLIFPFRFEFCFGYVSKCSHKSKNSFMCSAFVALS